ncbi:MAG: carbon-nitrogen hydrolase family protein [Planctomycetota bacterium]
MKMENTAPPVDSEKWKTWSPREDLAPRSGRRERDGSQCLWMASPDRFNAFGKWIAEGLPVAADTWYLFRASYRTEKVDYERTSVVAMITWMKQDRRHPILKRDYVEYLLDEGNGWKSLAGRLKSPEDAESVRIELFFRWSEKGEVWWRSVDLRPAKKIAGRKVRAVAVFDPTIFYQTREQLLKRAERVLDLAGKEKPDIICLTEIFPSRGMERPISEQVEPFPDGPGSKLLARKAREFSCYIAGSLYASVTEGGRDTIYNMGVLFDRQGRLVGTYPKVQITLNEAEKGVSPGRDFPVFDTDFGRVGMITCWDIAFCETVRILAARGAEMILLPIAGAMNWETTCQLRAVENGIYLVGSLSLRGPSLIMSPKGEILAKTHALPVNHKQEDPEIGLAVAECDLDFRMETRGSVDVPTDQRSLILVERRIDAFAPLSRSESYNSAGPTKESVQPKK